MKYGLFFVALLSAVAGPDSSDAPQDMGPPILLRNGTLEITCSPSDGTIALRSGAWEGFRLDALHPALRIDDAESELTAVHGSTYVFDPGLELAFSLEPAGSTGIRIRTVLRNASANAVVLNHVALLQSDSENALRAFGARPEAIRLLEQGNYWGRAVPLVAPQAEAASNTGEPTGTAGAENHASELLAVVYDRDAKRGFLAGFESSERWLGRIELGADANGNITRWRAGFDGGDLRLDPGETIDLETLLFLEGPDPWDLLDTYAALVRARFPSPLPDTPPVSWCSWYPYRLGVTEDRILETARIGAERLKPLGLRIIEIDLGWEKDQLPSTFEENDQFPHGLAWLSREIGTLGFDLGVWKAPFTISEFDPVAREHPEWLICDEAGVPRPYWEWFWKTPRECLHPRSHPPRSPGVAARQSHESARTRRPVP